MPKFQTDYQHENCYVQIKLCVLLIFLKLNIIYSNNVLINLLHIFLSALPQDCQTQVPWPRKEVFYSALEESCKSLSLATAKMVGAVRSQRSDDIVVGVAMGRRAATELLGVASTLAWNADTDEEKEE